MSDAGVLARHTQSTPSRAGLGLIDCDIHPTLRSVTDLESFLPERWRRHLENYGPMPRQPHIGSPPFPKAAPETARRDAWVPGGGRPGSDLAFMQRQHLDPNGVKFGILLPLLLSAANVRNVDFGTALCSAINDWQLAFWTSQDRRLRASIVVAPEDPTAAAAEIDKRASNADFVQVELPLRTFEPLGTRKYWPIFETAMRHGLPLGIHVNTVGGGYTSSGSGWPSYYFQEHQALAQSMKALVASFIFEGVFEIFAQLKIVLIEGGFAWVPALAWRMDRNWERMRDEVPHVRRPPSEYVRTNFWMTTQPMEEPEQSDMLLDTLRWIGADRLLFSSDYPHWDGDDPRYAMQGLKPEDRRKMLLENAAALYRLD